MSDIPTFDAADVLGGEGDYIRYGDITVRFLVVDPALATHLLETYNTHNRELQKYRSETHARDMTAGNWLITGDTIRFAKDPGHLYGPTGIVMIDGQHRLYGIKLSEIAQPCLIVTGLSLDAQEVVDTGASRSLADMLKLRGWVNSTKAAGAIRTVLSFKRGSLSTGGRNNDLSKIEMLQFADANRAAVEEAARYAARLLNTKFVGPSGAVSAAYYLCAEVDPVAAKLFFGEQIAEGIGLQYSDPAKALIRRIVNAGATPLPRVEVFWLTLKAWNHWRKNETVDRLQAPRGGWPTVTTDWPIF